MAVNGLNSVVSVRYGAVEKVTVHIHRNNAVTDSQEQVRLFGAEKTLNAVRCCWVRHAYPLLVLAPMHKHCRIMTVAIICCGIFERALRPTILFRKSAATHTYMSALIGAPRRAHDHVSTARKVEFLGASSVVAFDRLCRTRERRKVVRCGA